MIFKIAGLLIFMGLLSYFQIKQIYIKDGGKAVLAYVLLMSLAALIGSLLIAGVEIPSQVSISKIFEPIGKAVLGE